MMCTLQNKAIKSVCHRPFKKVMSNFHVFFSFVLKKRVVFLQNIASDVIVQTFLAGALFEKKIANWTFETHI